MKWKNANKKSISNQFQPVKITGGYVEFIKYWHPEIKKHNFAERLRKYIRERISFISSISILCLLVLLAVFLSSLRGYNMIIRFLFISSLWFFIFLFGWFIELYYFDQPMRFIIDANTKMVLITDQNNHRRMIAYSLENIDFFTINPYYKGSSQTSYLPTIPKREEWTINPEICYSVDMQLVYKRKKRRFTLTAKLPELQRKNQYIHELPINLRQKLLNTAKIALEKQKQKKIKGMQKRNHKINSTNFDKDFGPTYNTKYAYPLFNSRVRLRGDEWEAIENSIAKVLANAKNLEYEPFLIDIPFRVNLGLHDQNPETKPPAPSVRYSAKLYPEKTAIVKPLIYDNELNIVQVDQEKYTKNQNE